jgi:hypothetical protein
MTSPPRTRDELLGRMGEDGVGRLQLEFTDFIGVSRGRLVTREVLARDGLPNFPWVNIAHDVADGEPDPDHMGPGSPAGPPSWTSRTAGGAWPGNGRSSWRACLDLVSDTGSALACLPPGRDASSMPSGQVREEVL